jgi:antitoxin ParD1/3/4
MNKNTSISLGNYFEVFINSEINSGRYSTSSEVIRAGLRLLDTESKKINLLNIELQKGLDSEDVLAFDNDEFIKNMEMKYGR